MSISPLASYVWIEKRAFSRTQPCAGGLTKDAVTEQRYGRGGPGDQGLHVRKQRRNRSLNRSDTPARERPSFNFARLTTVAATVCISGRLDQNS
jgi:hypothetical protein